MTENGSIQCLCGRVGLEAELPPDKAGHCHCDNCRRAHGAGIWSWATFASERVRAVRGEGDLVRFTCDVGSTRSFCRQCGSTLLYESPRWPGVVDVSLANFTPSIDVTPTVHAYADRAPAWAPIHDDLPRQGGASGVEPL